MKKYILSTLVAVASMFLLSSCMKSEEVSSLYKPDVIFANNQIPSFTFSQSGGKVELTFRTKGDWEIVVEDALMYNNWFDLDCTSGKAGLATVELEVDSNWRNSGRMGEFYICSGKDKVEIPIRQKASDSSFEFDRYDFYSVGGKIQIEAQSALVFQEQYDWLEQEEDPSEPGIVNIIVSENKTGAVREAKALLTLEDRESPMEISFIQHEKLDIDFPDKVFKRCILAEWDSDGNGILSETELARISYLDISDEDIRSLEGIDKLFSLREVDFRDLYTLASFEDLRKSPSLAFITVQDASSIIEADFSGMDNLYVLDLEDCYGIRSIDVSNCHNLDELDMEDCKTLRYANLSGCESVTRVDMEDNYMLEQIDLTGCRSLDKLDCEDNHFLREIDLRDCLLLRYVDLYDCDSLRVCLLGDHPVLDNFDIDDGMLTELDFSRCPALTVLDVHGNHLTELDLSACTELEDLDVYDNNLSSLLLPAQMPYLVEFDFSSTLLDEVDFSRMPSLNYLSMNYTPIRKLDFSNNHEIESIDADHSFCSEFVASDKWESLDYISLQDTRLTSLDLSGIPHISDIWIDDCIYLENLNLEGVIRSQVHLNSIPNPVKIHLDKDNHISFSYSVEPEYIYRENTK